MDKKKDLLYFIEKLTGLEEFWKINYYLRAMKKAPHGGVVRIFQPNIYLKHYPFQAWTFMCHDPESIPHFMNELVDKAIELYPCVRVVIKKDAPTILGKSIVTYYTVFPIS